VVVSFTQLSIQRRASSKFSFELFPLNHPSPPISGHICAIRYIDV